jgi:iron uptake system component EfeO
VFAVVAASAAMVGVGEGNAGAASLPVLSVRLTPAGCPAKLKVASGPITFKLAVDPKSKVDEFEILDDNVVVTELEGLGPGFHGTFSVTLRPGKYGTYCRGGARERGTLVVTGTPPPDLGPMSQAAVDAYRVYLVAQTESLVSGTEAFADGIRRGDVEFSKVAYTAARAPYERIEPVAETFGDLDPRIDAREGDVPSSRWRGFHRIEKSLWVGGNTNNMGPIATQLVADTKQLEGYIPDMSLEPATIATGAVELLNEVSTTKITGEEERYSRTDLVDFESNVDGARAAFDAVRPLLDADADGAELAMTIEQRFAAVSAALAPYRTDDGFVPYTQLTRTDTKALSQVIDALAEPLSQVSRIVLAARAT